MTRVIHTGDTHIGYQQYNTPERRRDFLDAFRQVATDAIEGDVDALIHAGDLFHDRRPGLLDLQGTIEILRQLSAAEVPFLAVVGNHESKRDAQWLDLFSDLGLATRLGSTPVVVDDVAFYGLDFVPRSRRNDLEYEFDPPPDSATSTALVTHGLFEPFAHADWDTERLLEQSSIDFDVLLLGDNHVPDTAVVSGTWVTYCGSTERTSASERDARGYNLVTFDDEDDVAITRRNLPDTRPFAFVDVTLSADEGIERIRERIREHDVEGAVVIVTIEGEGTPVTPATVEAFALDSGALVARVNDRRELADEADDVTVSFADPDEAVRERIRDLGLSEAARSIDRTVRDETIADANVRETVHRRIRELLESGDESFADRSDASGDEGVDEDGTAEDGADETAEDGTDGTAEDLMKAKSDEPTEAETIQNEGSESTSSDSAEESTSAASADQAESVEQPDTDDSTEATESTDSESDDRTEHASLGDFT